jgi:hypothetical protein
MGVSVTACQKRPTSHINQIVLHIKLLLQIKLFTGTS